MPLAFAGRGTVTNFGKRGWHDDKRIDVDARTRAPNAVAQRNRTFRGLRGIGRLKVRWSTRFMDRPRSSRTNRRRPGLRSACGERSGRTTTFSLKSGGVRVVLQPNPVAGAHEGLDDLVGRRACAAACPMVTWTVFVNGSAFSSQTCSSRSSAKEGRARFHQRFQNRQFLHGKFDPRGHRGSPSGAEGRAQCRRHVIHGACRRLPPGEARTRSTSSGKWNGLLR